MSGQVLVLAAFLALGAACQAAGAKNGIRGAVWRIHFWSVSPLLVFVTFSTLHPDGRLMLALLAAILATWSVLGAGFVYAHLVSRERDERGALALAAGVGNTGFVGYPLAQIAYGHPGLALAVVYDRLAFLVPPLAVTTTVARLYGRRVEGEGRRLRALAANPPLIALVAALGLRAVGVHVPGLADGRSLGAAVVGPLGFFLLGLSLPLERPVHPPVELSRAAGALAIRFLGGPLALFAAGRLLGAHIPAVFYLLSAMPCGFNLLVLARVYDLRPALMRLLVVGSTLPAVAVVVIAFGIMH